MEKRRFTTNHSNLYSVILLLFVMVREKTEGFSSWLKKKKLRFIYKVILIIIVLLILFWLFMWFSPYADLKAFKSRPYSVRYYDRYGELLQITPLEDGLRREKPKEIPRYVKDIFIFAEDKRFYYHFGVDIFSMARAVYQNISRGRRVSGASTITMQLARIISSSKSQGFGQKIGEAINAVRLETRFSKDQILEMYLNSLPFGFSAEGAQSASRNFFSYQLHELTPAQVFCLAVIPRRPSFYNPLDNPENCMEAAFNLKTKFADNKRLSKKWQLFSQIDEKDFEFAVFKTTRRFQYPFEAPHLVRLANSENTKKSGEVRLSINLELQRYLQNAVAGSVAIHYSSRLSNGSAIVIDNETGEILAWVGSADFFNADAAGQIDGVLALNQPGSSMKPFLYAMALENNFLPSDVIADVPMTFGESEVYFPRNFNNRFNGPILFRASLASSLNIPAVYLLYRLSVRNYTQHLLDLGFNSLETSAGEAGLGLALGNAPVSLLELVRAFSVFPRDGILIPLTWELNDTVDRNRKNTEKEKRIYSPDTSRIICSFLSDSAARVLAFGAGRNFRTTFPAIFKTGTANQYQNIVALGATMKYTAGVWMGNFTGETVLDKTGSSVPAAIVRNTLYVLHRENQSALNNSSLNFPLPNDWKTRRICAVSGMNPTEACLSVINEYVRFDEIRHDCSWHRIVNGRSETTFPAEYQAWFNASVRQGSLDYSSRPLEIINPRDGFVYLSGGGFGINEITVEVIGGEGSVLNVTHNDSTFSVGRPFVFFLPRKQGINLLRVQNGYEEETITFTVE